MRLAAPVGLALVALVILLLTKDSFALRKIERTVTERVYGFDRFVNACVKLKVVSRELIGCGEQIELQSGQVVEVVRTHYRGGMIDAKSSPPRLAGWCAPGEDIAWLCSEDQEAIVLHDDDDPRGQIVVGSEGAGKTTALAIWHAFRWFENFGEHREGGQTAPTLQRLGLVKAEILKLWPEPWRRFCNRDDFTGFELCDGSRIRFVSTAPRPEKSGSPIQGFNWSWAGGDEKQDQVDVHSDIEARGRAAKDGGRYFKQLGTATAKDDPNWRTLRDQLETARSEDGARLWVLRSLYGLRSPFVHPSFWATKKATYTKREYQRRVLAIDVGPERAVYPDWARATNLIPVPFDSLGVVAGWTDVTAHELRTIGPNFQLLVGHDPGTLWDVSLLIKAFIQNGQHRDYLAGKRRPMWIVLGEVNTEQSTTQAHIVKLLETGRERWRLNLLNSQGKVSADGPQMLVHADPAGNTDQRTDKSVYTQFANAGIRIRPAAFSPNTNKHGRVPREAGVELVNTLICNASDERRLFVARNADGSPAAPKLVAALEGSERDSDGRAEKSLKGAHDMTHWPAALRYALWSIERPRLTLKEPTT